MARGSALWVKSHRIKIDRELISPDRITPEINKFYQAVDKTVQELTEIEAQLSNTVGEEKAEIIAAQSLMASDPAIAKDVEEIIRREHLAVESAVETVFNKHSEQIAALADDYLAERSLDLKDVSKRLLRILTGIKQTPITMTEPSVLLAYDLTPSQTAELDPSMVKGFVLIQGTPTSHTTILARSLGIPAVLAVGPELESVASGSEVLIYGKEGVVIVEPGHHEIMEYEQKVKAAAVEEREMQHYANSPAQSTDGVRVEVLANISSADEAKAALAAGAEGVGLLRTEFLFLNRSMAPAEEEQYEAYREIVDLFAPRKVVLRTLDIGGDKEAAYLDLPEELNPFLGVRGLRLSFRFLDLFKSQLRAICRASAYGPTGVMFPMVSTVDEFIQARNLVIEVQSALETDGIAYDPKMEIGVMIETPAAAMIADLLAPLCSFFSIGTNDLLQYTMAADRLNKNLAYLYRPENTALIRLIARTSKAARRAGIGISVCGEAAGELHMLPLFLGLGLIKLSVSPSRIPEIKKMIRTSCMKNAEILAQNAIQGVQT